MFIFLNGLLLGLSLIMALGPQNLFLIKQGTQKNHAGLSAIVCFICDVILVCGSVVGLHELLENNPSLQIWMLYLGSAFLLYYAYKNLKSALSKRNSNNQEPAQSHTRWQIVLFALGFSLLNPHAIIDTIVIVGSGSSQYPDNQMAFLMGVICASFIWFCSLTFTTKYFSDVLSKEKIWQGIEFLSGVLMFYIGCKLLLTGL
jgi:L-lysine exporter family protein LysE/ArgO